MTSFAARPCVLVLALGMASGAWAKDLPAPRTECDFLCKLQTYVASDHMVAMAPAPEAPPADSAARKPKVVTHRAPVKQQAATRKPATTPPPATPTVSIAKPVPRPKTAVRTRLARHATPLHTAATPAPEVSPRPLPAPAATARRDGTLIPGGAPMMAAQFEPAAAR